jgi:hypothetical protein
LKTVYGRRRFSVLEPEQGAGVLITLKPVKIPVGVRVKGDGVLKEDLVIDSGSLLMRRGNRFGQPLWAIYGGGIYSARRGLLHALAGYDDSRVGGNGGEIKEALRDFAALGEVSEFLRVWRRLSAEERTAISEALLAFVGEHENDRDPNKVAALDSIESVADLCDRLGRKNPQVTSVRIEQARRAILERLSAMKSIDPRLMFRYTVVDREIDLELGVTRSIYVALRRFRESLDRTPRSAKELGDLLGRYERQLSFLAAAPYSRAAEDIRSYLLRFAELQSKSRTAASLAFLNSTIARLGRLLAGHTIFGVVEDLAVLPQDPGAQAARIEEVKETIRRFKARHPACFARLRPNEAPPEWRLHFYQGARAIVAGNFPVAKAHYASMALEFVSA